MEGEFGESRGWLPVNHVTLPEKHDWRSIASRQTLDRRRSNITGDEFKIILKQMSCDTFSLIYLQTNEYS